MTKLDEATAIVVSYTRRILDSNTHHSVAIEANAAELVDAIVAVAKADCETRIATCEKRIATCEDLLRQLVDVIRKEIEKPPKWNVGP